MNMDVKRSTEGESGLSSLQAEVAHKMVSLISAARWNIGDRLSDAAIAKELRVSRSPVRQVLNLLVQQGIVSQTPNRGYQLHRIPEPDELNDNLLPPSEAEELYRRLMSARASGAVGDEVSEAELADQLGATRGAVRRVLMRFATEGLAERLPGHGWRFAESLDNERAVNESYAFRPVIECGALSQPDYAPDSASSQLCNASRMKYRSCRSRASHGISGSTPMQTFTKPLFRGRIIGFSRNQSGGRTIFAA